MIVVDATSCGLENLGGNIHLNLKQCQESVKSFASCQMSEHEAPEWFKTNEVIWLSA